MMVYKVIYSFEVFDKIKEGKNVGFTDRQRGVVRSVNDMTVSELSEVLMDFDKTKGRYEFWVEEEQEETKNEAV